jgi:hypothetical protein
MTGTDGSSGSGSSVDTAAFEAVEAWSKSWFLDDETDLLAFEGLPVGWALHIEIFEAVLGSVLPALGRPQRVVGRSVFRPFKLMGWDRAARSWALRVMGGASAVPPAKVVFVSELATPSALDGPLAVAAVLPRGSIVAVAADPRALRAWRRAGHRAVPMLLGLGEQRRRLALGRAELRDRWDAAASARTPLIVADRDLTDVAFGAARPIVLRSGPWLAVEAASIATTLAGAAPRTVALASDQHRIGRLVSHVAREAGIRSVVLQHGLPQSTLGYVPVVADRVFAWSDHAVDWFAGHGTPRERLLVCGNPRLDASLGRLGGAADPDASAQRRGGSRLLAALSVAPAEVNLRVLETALGALAASPEATLVVKLHPGGSDWRALHERLRARDVPKHRVRVAEREDILPLIHSADIVVVHRSTVAVDALASRRPVVVVSAGTPSIGDVELRELDLPEVRTGRELAAMATGLREDEEAARYWVERRSKLGRILGPLDGRAAERIATMLLGATRD